MFQHLFGIRNLRSQHRTYSRNLNSPRRLCLEALEARYVLSTSYIATDLISDQPGVAPLVDESLHNAWGIAVGGPNGNFWVSSEEEGISEVYNGDVHGSPIHKETLEGNIPGGDPTGQVFNNTTDFVVTSGASSGASVFIFSSKSGSVTGWNPAVPPPPPSVNAQLGFQANDDAIYTGIALASNGGQNFLYVADFGNGKIDVLDKDFHLTTLTGTFTDPNLPEGYAPFNVAAINGKLYVTYAQRDDDSEEAEEVHGQGKGFVDVYNTNGVLEQRLISRDKLNAPWGLVVAPANFGDFSNSLLVGNVGSGRILAYNADTGEFQGTLRSSPGHPFEAEELWGLAFGNGNTSGDTNTLYYAAGPDDEVHGVFGKITANPEGTLAAKAVLNGDVLEITGGRDADHILVKDARQNQIVVLAEGKRLGSFNAASIATIEFQGFAGNDFVQVLNGVKIKTILDGGADNDTLFGGGGPSVLLGGPGNDWLYGGRGRDLIVGGEGHDHEFGGNGEDLMIGGSTTHDADSAALLQILTEWTSADSFDVRVSKLTNGTGGLPKLDNTTIVDDGIRDQFFGGLGHDWVIKGTNDLAFEV